MNRTYYRLLHDLQDARQLLNWCRFAITTVRDEYNTPALSVWRLQQHNTIAAQVKQLEERLQLYKLRQQISKTEIVKQIIGPSAQYQRIYNRILITPTNTISCGK